MNLKVIRLKPNPAGKDITLFGATAEQLAGEWVDIRNEGTTGFDLRGLFLYHQAYVGTSAEWKWAPVISSNAVINNVLPPWQTLRVHSGAVRSLDVVRQEDMTDADLHAFTGRDAYIWNNSQSDAAAVWNPANKQFIDRADYGAFPPEGSVLVRQGDMLLPTFGARVANSDLIAALLRSSR